MSLNNIEINKVINELKKLIIPSQIRKIIEIDHHTFVLKLYHKQNTNLLISLKHSEMRIHISNKNLRSQANNSNILLYLRKHIENAVIRDIRQLNNDRIIEFTVIKNEITYYLIIEMIGKQKDILLLDINKVIMYNLNKELGIIASIYKPPNKSDYVPKTCIPEEKDKLYNQSIEEHYNKVIGSKGYKDNFCRIDSYLKKAIKKSLSLLDNLNKQKTQCSKWIDYQQQGELLKANLYQLKRGLNNISLMNYFNNDGSYIKIDLDPKKEPSDNLNHYFKKAKKLKSGLTHIETRFKSAKEDYDKIQRIYSTFEGVNSLTQLDDFLLNHKDEPPIKKLATLKQGTKKLKPTISYPYRVFISSTGKRILVGKKNKDNDKLSFSIAKGRDMWLHIRDYSGSHVVVPLGKDEDIEQQTLIDAATLALNYSKAKLSQKGEVIYTKRKNISKRKGSPPGEVQVSAIKTIYIELDKDRMDRLKSSIE